MQELARELKPLETQMNLARLAPLLVFLGACSSFDPADQSYEELYGPGQVELPPEWACLTDDDYPMVPREAKTVTYVTPIVDFDSQPTSPTVVPGLQVMVCGDATCAAPAANVQVIQMPDRPFLYAIQFPYGFANASLKLTAPGYVPMYYAFGGPMVGLPEGEHTVMGLGVPLLSEQRRDFIYGDIGLSQGADAGRGVLAVRTLNCLRQAKAEDPFQGQRAAGVRVRAVPRDPEPPAASWTLSNSNVATPNNEVTDERGVAGFLNVLPGTVQVEGVARFDGTELPYGRTPVRVRADAITLAEVRPGLDQWGQ
ncbi:MAG TPA: hypothetical protein VIM73_21165 [Polyangiaceae bacterium]